MRYRTYLSAAGFEEDPLVAPRGRSLQIDRADETQTKRRHAVLTACRLPWCHEGYVDKAEVHPAPSDAATVVQLRNHASSSCIKCGTKRGFFFSFLSFSFLSFFFSLIFPFEGFACKHVVRALG